MMVERLPLNVGQLMSDLDRATKTLETMNTQPQAVSKQDLKDLIQVLKDFNSTLNPGVLQDKKLVPEGMNAKIEKALNAILLFQSTHTAQKEGQRNVDQAIASLASTLNETRRTLDKHLKDLKKYKIGQKVEKIDNMDEKEEKEKKQ